jgi:hypothetical protein
MSEQQFSEHDSIDKVIRQLGDIVDDCRRKSSRLGYFAALYRIVTLKVRDGIIAGDFEDNDRMEKLDVLFANRYIEAYEQYHSGSAPLTRSWLSAFQAAEKWRLLIIQHLLLGINAHINLDLGIAAALTSPGDKIDELKNDFDKINDILSGLLDIVQDRINSVSRGFALLDRIGGRTDEAIMNFSIQKAREEAWKFATELADLPPQEQQNLITKKDQEIRNLAELVQSPGWFVNLIAFFIRLFESGNVLKVIDVLFKP